MTATSTPAPGAPGQPRRQELVQLGNRAGRHDFLVALAGNPNTGKSTVFNALTGLRQHTGNWPGKTVARAEGVFQHGGKRIRLVDLPGTYSLQAGQHRRGGRARFHAVRPARRHGGGGRRHPARAQSQPRAADPGDHRPGGRLPQPDGRGAAPRHRDRSRQAGAGAGRAGRRRRRPAAARAFRSCWTRCSRWPAASAAPRPTGSRPIRPRSRRRSGRWCRWSNAAFPGLPNARWVALRLLQGDQRIETAVRDRRDRSTPDGAGGCRASGAAQTADGARRGRTGCGGSCSRASRTASRRGSSRGAGPSRRGSSCGASGGRKFDFDRRLDQLLTSRIFGFPVMLLILTVVFWLTITGANVPPALLADGLIDQLQPWLKRRGRPARACPGGSTASSSTGCTWPPRGWSASCCRRWRSSSRSSPCWRTSAICRGWPSISTRCSAGPAPTASRRSRCAWASAATPPAWWPPG